MKQNNSQYTGTLKNSVCLRCGKNLNNKSRTQQDQHEKQCIQQKKIFEVFEK